MTIPSEPSSIGVPSTRRLLALAFELLSHSSEDLRRASFYIGVIVLGTVGPVALAVWALGVTAIERSPTEIETILTGSGGAVLGVLGILAIVGIVVASVESRNVAIAILGARMAGRDVTPRQALARSRQVFWSAVVGAIIVAIPLGIAEGIASSLIDPFLGEAVEGSVATTTAVTAIVGAPFAYVLSGIVLGDVGPGEAIRRSVRVFGARRLAAVLVVLFETIAFLLIFLGISAGLDILIRVLDATGLGPDAGPAGLSLLTAALVAAVFAFGTLVFTVIALTVAPQVVMFVGLTHATLGLDHVTAGARSDPEIRHGPAARPFRTLTTPMLGGFAVGAVLLVIAVSEIAG